MSSLRNDPDYFIDTWEKEDGLPGSSVTAMAQTPDGYLWVGTFSGLARFNGMDFRVFNPSNTPNMPGTGVVNIHLAKSGSLWVSTIEGLGVRDGASWRKFGPEDGWPGDTARTISERGNGDLLITTFNGNIVEFSGGRFTSLPSPGESGYGYFGHADENGQWWVVQHRFIGRWDGRQWVSMIQPPELRPSEVGCGRAKDGGMWLLLGSELRKIREAREVSRVVLPDRHKNVWGLSEDQWGNVWISSDGNGLHQVTRAGASRTWMPDSGLASRSVRFAFEDRERCLWVGTNSGGLQRFRRRIFRGAGVNVTGEQPIVRSVAAGSSGHIWLGMYGQGGLAAVNAADGSRITFAAEPNAPSTVTSVLEDRAGRLWWGGFNEAGLWLAGNQHTRRLAAAKVGAMAPSALFEDSRGRVWISGGREVFLFEGGEFRVQGSDDGVPEGFGFCFTEDHTGAIWLAHSSGVFRQKAGRFAIVRDRSGKPLSKIIFLHADADGDIWLGSEDGTLHRWHHGNLDQIGSGLPAQSLFSMIEDDVGFCWMTSERGVLRTSMHDLRAAAGNPTMPVPCQVFDRSDGIPSIEFPSKRQPVSARDESGRLWFATSKGLAVVNPADLEAADPPPRVEIEALSWQRAVAKPGDGTSPRQQSGKNRLYAPFAGRVSLPPGSRWFELSYAGLRFSAPQKVRYQVMLEGYDTSWQDAHDLRVASFHDLPPHDYVFRVRAANEDGLWGQPSAGLAFTVEPFYWQTTWFRAAIGLLLAAAGGGAGFWANRARHRRLAAELELAAQQRRADEKLRLIIEAAPNALVMVDTAGQISMVNAQTEAVFGYARTEILGQSIEVLLPGYLRDLLPSLRQGCRSHSEARSMGAGRELSGLRKDGAEVAVEVGLNPVLAAEGTFVLVSIVDITERQRAEREAMEQRDELFHLSRVASLGELSGSLAHELNQPLGIILSNAQAAQRMLAGESPDLPELREILADIVSEDRRAGEVITRLRALLKRGKTRLVPLALSEVVDDVLRLLRSDLVARGVTVQVSRAGRLPDVPGDQVQLQQVLLNLIINACDAMAETPPTERIIHISTSRREGKVRVSLQDCGCGLPDGDASRIFQPFVTTKSHGMGIGLSICLSIVAAHHGRLWAEANAGPGATFHLELPIVEPPAP